MAKIVKIIVLNILLILLILFITNSIITTPYQKLAKPRPAVVEYMLETTERFEQDLEYDKNKPPIMVVGCSFVYGNWIEQFETFPYKLQKLTKRKVYNYGMPGHGVQHLLYKIQNSFLLSSKAQEPEYLIYVFIEDHMRRMYKDYRMYDEKNKYLRYRVRYKNGKKEPYVSFNSLYNINPVDYWRITQVARRINEFFFIVRSDNRKFDLFKIHLLESQKTLKKNHPNTKLVVIVYNSSVNTKTDNSKPFQTSRWKELEEEGIKVINFQKDEYEFLTKPEYNTNERYAKHPSALAWDVLTPIIIKELNIH